MGARRLTPAEIQAEVLPAIARLFRYPIPFPECLRDEVPGRLLLRCSAFSFDEAEFAAVSASGAAVGDDSLRFTLLERYSEGQGEVSQFSWKLDLFAFDDYDGVAYEDPEVGEVFGIPLHRVLHSPNGTWGILFDDCFAVVGGSMAFVEQMKQAYPQWRDEVEQFFRESMERARKNQRNATWIEQLLRHVNPEQVVPPRG